MTKSYEFSTNPGADDENPFEFEGVSLVNAKGCEINWLSKEKHNYLLALKAQVRYKASKLEFTKKG